MVFGGIFESKAEKSLKFVRRVANESNIVSLTNTCNMDWTQVGTKSRVLSESEFSIVSCLAPREKTPDRWRT